jgi:folate-dependent phosphoribosylglycinamide formyltransferase PurN
MTGSGNTALILHADDLGFSSAANVGIREAATGGALTSTSLMADGPGFDEAVSEVLPECPNLGIGAHLELGEVLGGRRPRSPQGEFAHLLRRQRDTDLLGRLERRLRDQLERVLNHVPSVDHVNSHWHVHAVPALFDLVSRLAREYGIPYVRLPRERFFHVPPVARGLPGWYLANLAKLAALNRLAGVNAATARRYGVATNDWLVGIAYTGHMTTDTIVAGVEALSGAGGVVEVLLHPGRVVADRRERYANADARRYELDPARVEELKALLDPNLGTRLRRLGFDFACYRCLAAEGHGDGDPAHRHGEWQPPPPAPRGRPPLRTFIVMDEGPFYHPEYLRRLITECDDLDIRGAALVRPQGGSVIERYLRKRLGDLRYREFVRLGLKRVGLQLMGQLPRALRGEHEGSVAAVLRRFGIPHRLISRLDPQVTEYVRSFEPDVILSSSSLIFKDDLLAVARVACINRHSALLPAYGGVLPVFRAVQKGEAYTGASVHVMVPDIDKGPVLSRKWVPIFSGDTLELLYQACFRVSYDATVEAAHKLRWGADELHLDGEGLQPSYFSFPDDDDWQEFRARGGRFI